MAAVVNADSVRSPNAALARQRARLAESARGLITGNGTRRNRLVLWLRTVRYLARSCPVRQRGGQGQQGRRPCGRAEPMCLGMSGPPALASGMTAQALLREAGHASIHSARVRTYRAGR
jgi:hypothetical protein